MAKDGLTRRYSAEVDVGSFPSHGVKKAELGAGSAQGSQFDAGTVGAETADDPTAAELDEGIGAADGAVDDDLIENFGGTFVILSPIGRGWDEGFGLAGDASSVPVGDGDIAGVTKAAEPGDAVSEAERDVTSRHEVLKGIDGADGTCGFKGGKGVHLSPEVDGVAEFAFGNEAQPAMVLPENERASFFAHGFDIACENGAADVFAFQGKASGLGGKMGADGEPNEVDRIGHGPGFVEIIDSPDKAAFDVAPGTEIFHVKIADREDLWGFGEIATDLWPDLCPAIEGRAEESEKLFLHAGVLEADVFWVDASTLRQPGFKLAGGFDHVHAGNHSGAENEKSNSDGGAEGRNLQLRTQGGTG